MRTLLESSLGLDATLTPTSAPSLPIPEPIAAATATPPAVVPWSALGETPVASVMGHAPAPLAPQTPLSEVTARLMAAEVSRLPVVGPDGVPVGTVGNAEVLDAWQRGMGAEVAVERVMVPFLLAVPHDAPLSQAVALMAFEGVQCLGVLDGQRQLAGMLGALDVLRWLWRDEPSPG